MVDLDDYARRAVAAPVGVPPEMHRIEALARRHHRQRVVYTVAGLIAALVAVMVLVLATAGGNELGVKVSPASNPPGVQASSPHGTWRALPSLPPQGHTWVADSARSIQEPTLVAAGDEIVLLATSVFPEEAVDSVGNSVQGFVYTPSSGGWRKIATSPLDGWRANAGVVWTGREVIVAGGGRGSSLEHVAAAYDLNANSWRLLSPPPPPRNAPFDGATDIGDPALWDGREVLFPTGLVAYDPATDSWRRLPDSPLGAIGADQVAAWTGEEMIVWGGCRRPGPCSDERVLDGTIAEGAAYNPRTNTWRLLAPSPLARRVNAQGVWTGEELVVYGGIAEASGAYGAAYRPAEDSWRVIADGAGGSRLAMQVVEGNVVVVNGRGSTEMYVSSDDRWISLPDSPLAPRELMTSVAVGNEVYVWGGRALSGPFLYTNLEDGAILELADGP